MISTSESLFERLKFIVDFCKTTHPFLLVDTVLVCGGIRKTNALNLPETFWHHRMSLRKKLVKQLFIIRPREIEIYMYDSDSVIYIDLNINAFLCLLIIEIWLFSDVNSQILLSINIYIITITSFSCKKAYTCYWFVRNHTLLQI